VSANERKSEQENVRNPDLQNLKRNAEKTREERKERKSSEVVRECMSRERRKRTYERECSRR